MMKWIKTTVLAVAILLCFSAPTVHAQGVWGACENAGSSSAAICGDKRTATGVVKNIINLFLYAIGILSVIMIIHSGMKYVNSRGDAEAIKSAKNTLLYAVVGLIVAMMAFTIVNFVISSFGAPVNTGPAADGGNVDRDGQGNVRDQ